MGSSAQTLNKRQKEIFEFIKNTVRKKGFPPSIREIGEAVGVSSSSTVHSHLHSLESKGLIKRDPAKPRTITIEVDEESPAAREIQYYPLLSKISSLKPVICQENVCGTFPLPTDWVGAKNVFIMETNGDSMKEAAILSGDQIIVRMQDTAEDGDIVVAIVNDEPTVKRYFKEQGYIRLEPDNHRMKPILIKYVSIIGKVIGVMRKFC
ncbi:MAG: transcriptional repressor LexA [Firmicutes bacterium]|nr:transcriptional repressor LexA [Bacillota bacterium]